ncbi:MAG: oligosaccharide flippase family protein [Brevinematia bacterium]
MRKIIRYSEFLKKDGFKKVFENFTWLSILQVIDRFAGIIVIPYLIRTIGIEKWGLIAFAQSFILYFGTVVGYGFHLIGVRDISQNRDSIEKLGKIFYSILATKTLLFIISSIIYFSIVLSFKKFNSELLLFTFNFFYILGYSFYPDWFFQGIEKMKFSTILGSIARFSYVFLVFIFIKEPDNYVFVPLLNSVSVILMGISGLFLAIFKFKIKFYFPKIRDIILQLKEGFHIFLSQLYLSLYSNSRVFILGIFTSSGIVGNYALAEKIINIMGIPLGIFANAIFPRLSLKYKENINNFKKIFKICILFSVLWAIILCSGNFIFGKFILSIFAGDSYNNIALYSLYVLILGLFFNQISVFLTQNFILIDKMKIFSRIYLISTFTGLISLLIMTPLIQYKGIAIASVLFEMTIFIVSIYYFKKEKILI